MDDFLFIEELKNLPYIGHLERSSVYGRLSKAFRKGLLSIEDL